MKSLNVFENNSGLALPYSQVTKYSNFVYYHYCNLFPFTFTGLETSSTGLIL